MTQRLRHCTCGSLLPLPHVTEHCKHTHTHTHTHRQTHTHTHTHTHTQTHAHTQTHIQTHIYTCGAAGSWVIVTRALACTRGGSVTNTQGAERRATGPQTGTARHPGVSRQTGRLLAVRLRTHTHM